MSDNFGPEKHPSWRDFFRQLENGPEKHAPPQRRSLETPDEGVKNVVTLLAKQQPEAPAPGSAEHLNEIIQRVATDSRENIDRVIFDLESVRDVLRKEGARVSREVSGYASLNQAATAAMKVIAEGLKQWKERPSQNKEK